MIAFIQACGLYRLDHGGSPRIFRSLLDSDHPPVVSINTHFSAAPAPSANSEIALPSRPSFGRLERTRFHTYLGVFDQLFRRRFETKLRRVLTEHKVNLVHILPSTYSFLPACAVASHLGIPYFVTVHDDLEYVSRGHIFLREMVTGMGQAWREAKGVFVISDEIGRDYSRRYGAREYRVVTDGLRHAADAPKQGPEKSLRFYFMGLFHNTYEQNLRAALDALQIVRSRQPDWDISVTCRCGSIAYPIHHDDVPVVVLPFAPQEEVEKDMLSADLLYLPMPFQEYARAFNRFSMSTKMITYLGSGLPILYHGPEDAGACKLLARHQAAQICTTLDPGEIAEQLLNAASRRDSIVTNALALARSQFMLADQQRRFWEPILQALEVPGAAR